MGSDGDQPNLKRELSLKMTVVARQIRMRFDEEAERAGVTRAHWTLIAAVARVPGATQKTIAGLLQISEVSAGRLIDKLSTEGLIVRQTDDTDRRAYRLHLTDAARPLLNELGVIARENEARVFAGLSEEELRELDRLLGVVARNVGMKGDAAAGWTTPTAKD